MSEFILLAYLGASILFILGLKGLTSPRTAVRGNMLGALGMLIAIVATLVDQNIVSYYWIVAGLAIGAGAGYYLATTTAMTEMPELVALFNGFGGIASALVASAEFYKAPARALEARPDMAAAIGISALIGWITFSGSVLAFIKLRGLAFKEQVRFPAQQLVNIGLFVGSIGLVVLLALAPANWWAFVLISLFMLTLGVTLVLPIGGADMPVVIALLNSCSGLAASATGFVLTPPNSGLIIAGALVGASGLILTGIMCKAMNRSIWDVAFGELGVIEGGVDGDIYAGNITSSSAEEVAMMLDYASRVVFVPGYGMAVAQAQHAVRDLADTLKKKGCEVLYGIHPVAGRMPGHMNVLLAEAEVPYDELMDLDQINPMFSQTDVAIVLGANDVVNPLAREEGNPVSGMPILNVDKASTVVVIKRSLSHGFAGIPNPLFIGDNTVMFFSDGKKAIMETTASLTEV